MKYVRQLRIPANLSHEDLLSVENGSFHCNRLKIKCQGIRMCNLCMIFDFNKPYFQHWFKNQYKGERLKKGKMSIKLDGKEL